MIELINWTWFNHNFGIGISLDWQNIWIHPLIYGLTVPVWAFLFGVTMKRALRGGFYASITAAIYLEALQAWQYHWQLANGDHVGMGDPLDLLLSCGAAYGVYWLLRKL